MAFCFSLFGMRLRDEAVSVSTGGILIVEISRSEMVGQPRQSYFNRVIDLARLRKAIGGAVWPSRIASSATVFQPVTISAWTRPPMRSAVEAHQERSLKVFNFRNEVGPVVCIADLKSFCLSLSRSLVATVHRMPRASPVHLHDDRRGSPADHLIDFTVY